jgi:hypothetical protein
MPYAGGLSLDRPAARLAALSRFAGQQGLALWPAGGANAISFRLSRLTIFEESWIRCLE